MHAESNSAIDVSNINEKVYLFLKDRLLDLTYPPGAKINVRRLQKELGISYTPIKDALFRLAGEGLVEVTSRRGTYAKQVSTRDLVETVEARIIIETGCLETIADKLTDQQLVELEELYLATLCENGCSDYRLFLQRDGEFHMAFIRFTGNRRLIRLFEQLNAHMQIARFRFAPKSQERLSGTDRAHESILDALKERDGQRASRALRTHLQTVRDIFLKLDTTAQSPAQGAD